MPQIFSSPSTRRRAGRLTTRSSSHSTRTSHGFREPMGKNSFSTVFFPKPCLYCQPAGEDSPYYRASQMAEITVDVKLPHSFEFAGPGEVKDGRLHVETTARNYAFALGKNFKRISQVIAGIPVTIAYHSEGFRDLVPTLEKVLPAQIALFGPFPFHELVIVETSELQRHGLPGLIAMNRPRQSLFSIMQKDWLNWQHWILASMLALQRYGGAVTVENPDDEWLVSGILSSLQHSKVSTTCRTALISSISRKAGTDSCPSTICRLRKSRPPRSANSPRLPCSPMAGSNHMIRSAFKILFFISSSFSPSDRCATSSAKRPFTGLFQPHEFSTNSFVTPLAFHDFLNQFPSAVFAAAPGRAADVPLALVDRRRMAADFRLESFEKEELPDGRWIAKVTAAQDGTIDFPPLVAVEDSAGRVCIVPRRTTPELTKTKNGAPKS